MLLPAFMVKQIEGYGSFYIHLRYAAKLVDPNLLKPPRACIHDPILAAS